MGSPERSKEGRMASLRRNARERKEFLYRKSLENKDREEYERKQKLKRLIENGSKIPKELKHEEAALRREMDLLGSKAAELKSMQDDEYQLAGVDDPKLFLTTSSDPSSRLASFAKELKLIFPNCTRVNRGHLGISDLVELCRQNNVTDMIIVHETRVEPDGMIVSHLPYGPTAYFALYNTVLRHDIDTRKKMTLATPHLLFHNFGTPLGERTQTFYNKDDYISFRPHRVDKVDHRTVDL